VAAVDVAVENAMVNLPEDIVKARGQERWDRVERQMQGQGMNPDTYLQMQGKTRDEIIEESLPDAEQEIKRESVLVAVADAEEIEVTDAEMEEELDKMREKLKEKGTEMKEDARKKMQELEARIEKLMEEYRKAPEKVK